MRGFVNHFNIEYAKMFRLSQEWTYTSYFKWIHTTSVYIPYLKYFKYLKEFLWAFHGRVKSIMFQKLFFSPKISVAPFTNMV